MRQACYLVAVAAAVPEEHVVDLATLEHDRRFNKVGWKGPTLATAHVASTLVELARAGGQGEPTGAVLLP